MSKSFFSFEVQTKEKQSFTNLDRYLNVALQESTVENGIMVIYCPHTTAAITINENADPDVKRDLRFGLMKHSQTKKNMFIWKEIQMGT